MKDSSFVIKIFLVVKAARMMETRMMQWTIWRYSVFQFLTRDNLDEFLFSFFFFVFLIHVEPLPMY